MFEVLYNAKEPITVYQIARRGRLAYSSAKYGVEKLREIGCVLSFEEGNKTLYTLHPVFFHPSFWENIISKVTSAMKDLVRMTKQVEKEWGLEEDLKKIDYVRAFLVVLRVLVSVDMY